MQGGGLTRGGKSQRGARRTISKGKYKRVLAPQKPTKTELKSKAFTEDKILKESTEQLDKTKYFGPILAVSSKIMNKEEPTDRDYQNVGLGINMLISQGIQQQQLKGGIVAAFAGGGLVDPDVLSAAETGGDISNWVAKTFRGEIESNAQKTLRMIREKKEEKEKQPPTTTPTPTDDLVPGAGLTAGQWGPMLDLISSGEGGYTSVNPGLVRPGILDMNLQQLLSFKAQSKRTHGGSAALGRYQFINPELAYSLGGINPNEKFTKANQDKMAVGYLEKKRPGKEWLAGKITTRQYIEELSNEWGAFRSYSGNVLPGNSGKIGPEKIEAALNKVKKGGYSQQELYMSPSGGALGAGYGSGGSKIAGDLGDYMKQTRIPTGSIHQHPRHLPMDRRGYNSYHNEGRAIDLGGYGPAHPSSGGRDEQAPILRALIEWNKKRGVTPVQVIHGSPAFRGFGKYESGPNDLHSHHVHVAYAKGGETLDGPHLAMVGEKGREIVIDNDSVESHPEVRQMLLAINQASNYQGVLNAIRQYAPYDAMSPQTIVIPSPSAPEEDDDYGNVGGVAFLPIGEGGDDPFSTLYQGG